MKELFLIAVILILRASCTCIEYNYGRANEAENQCADIQCYNSVLAGTWARMKISLLNTAQVIISASYAISQLGTSTLSYYLWNASPYSTFTFYGSQSLSYKATEMKSCSNKGEISVLNITITLTAGNYWFEWSLNNGEIPTACGTSTTTSLAQTSSQSSRLNQRTWSDLYYQSITGKIYIPMYFVYCVDHSLVEEISSSSQEQTTNNIISSSSISDSKSAKKCKLASSASHFGQYSSIIEIDINNMNGYECELNEQIAQVLGIDVNDILVVVINSSLVEVTIFSNSQSTSTILSNNLIDIINNHKC